MNRQWMRDKLETFKALCEEYEREPRRTTDYTGRQPEISADMESQDPTIRRILKAVEPVLAAVDTRPMHLTGVTRSPPGSPASPRHPPRPGRMEGQPRARRPRP